MRAPEAVIYGSTHHSDDLPVLQNPGFPAVTWHGEMWCKISGSESSAASATWFFTRQM